MSVRTYSPRKMVLSLGGIIISGFAENTFINFQPSSDSFEKMVGASGETSRVEKADRTGRLIITLHQTSPSNEYLTGLHQNDRLSLAGAVPVLLKDLNGLTVISAESCWVARLPDADYDQSVGDREWTLDVDDMIAFYGRNNNSTIGG